MDIKIKNMLSNFADLGFVTFYDHVAEKIIWILYKSFIKINIFGL